MSPELGEGSLAGTRIDRELAMIPLVEFADDPRNHGSAERFLQLAERS